MNLEELADDAKKENIIAIVSSMSKIDGKIHENEFIYLLKLGLTMGMSDDVVRRIMVEDRPAMFIPKSEQDRMTIFYYLVFLMKIDGQITTEESDLLHHFGLKLGFNPLMIENVVRIVKANIEELPPNAILNEVKKYLN